MTSNMQIVILDGYTLTHGDLDWEALRQFGEVTAYDRSSVEDIPIRAATAEIILTNKAPLSREYLKKLPALRYVGVTATGTNVVDLAACSERGIVVSNVPGYTKDSVAQLVFTHLLNLTQRVADLSQAVRDGQWAAAKDFCCWDVPLVELRGLTMGIVGFGQIGQVVARLSHAFDMRVIVHTRSAHEFPSYVECVELDEVFRKADVVSLHCPLTPETEKMVNEERLSEMKRTAYLINTSRGPLVDESALARALRDGEIAGAGLDVLCQEPPEADNPLCNVPNCYITPHVAWASLSARRRLMDQVVSNVAAFLQGKPVNVVN